MADDHLPEQYRVRYLGMVERSPGDIVAGRIYAVSPQDSDQILAKFNSSLYAQGHADALNRGERPSLKTAGEQARESAEATGGCLWDMGKGCGAYLLVVIVTPFALVGIPALLGKWTYFLTIPLLVTYLLWLGRSLQGRSTYGPGEMGANDWDGPG